MLKKVYHLIQKSLFWSQINSKDSVIDTKVVEKYFDKTQSIIFTDIYAAKEESVLLPVIANYKPNSVLDLGCGNGRYSKSLYPQVKEYVGVDLSNNFIQELRKNNKIKKYDFIHSPAHEFKIQRKFDLILMIGLLTYMNDDDISEMILNSSKHLNKDGVIIVRNVNHGNNERSFFNDKWNFLKYFIKKPSYQIIRRPESEFLNFFSEFKLINKFNITDTAGVVYIFKLNV
tara:strand:- start:783 stop:1472 length:690 start_codon:yes stop_codon:yes gene_type:complete